MTVLPFPHSHFFENAKTQNEYREVRIDFIQIRVPTLINVNYIGTILCRHGTFLINLSQLSILSQRKPLVICK